MYRRKLHTVSMLNSLHAWISQHRTRVANCLPPNIRIRTHRSAFKHLLLSFFFCLQAIEPNGGETEAKGAEIAAS